MQWHRGEGEEKIMTNGDKAGEKIINKINRNSDSYYVSEKEIGTELLNL